MEPGYLDCNLNEKLSENNTKFGQATGSLLYLTTISWTDTLEAVNLLSRKNENSTGQTETR